MHDCILPKQLYILRMLLMPVKYPLLAALSMQLEIEKISASIKGMF